MSNSLAFDGKSLGFRGDTLNWRHRRACEEWKPYLGLTCSPELYAFCTKGRWFTTTQFIADSLLDRSNWSVYPFWASVSWLHTQRLGIMLTFIANTKVAFSRGIFSQGIAFPAKSLYSILLYIPWVVPPPSNSGNSNPGGDSYWEGGQPNIFLISCGKRKPFAASRFLGAKH